MSEVDKSFTAPSEQDWGSFGVEDNLWSILAILSLLGCCGRGSFVVLYSSLFPEIILNFTLFSTINFN